MANPEPIDSLPFRGRILVRRLESFGDIVVGFSMSELALQLGVPHTASDVIANPVRYLFFFATFAIIAILWLRYHRMLTMGFAPGRIDLFFAFSFLACTALLPYALYTVDRVRDDPHGWRYGFVAYSVVLLGTSLSGFGITLRALLRSKDVLDEVDLTRMRLRIVVELSAIVAIVIAIPVDIYVGPQYAGPVFFLIFIGSRLGRLLYRAPTWDAVHVHGTSPQPD